MTTDKLAAGIGNQPQSIIVHLCRKGSYYGLVPIKLPNGRLKWPDDSIERLEKMGAAK